MKTSCLLPALLACCLPVSSQSLVSSGVMAERTLPTGPHESQVEIIRLGVDVNGRRARVTNSYVTLATGLNHWEQGRSNWTAAVPEFEPTRNGHFVARRTRTQLILPPDLSTEPVDMLGPDGVRLISAPLGVAVLDLSTGDTALLGSLTNCQAEWVTPHTVVYRNCFTGLKADLVYEINLAGMEQFLILREWIPALEYLGMDPGHVRVQVYTEFLDAPEPTAHLTTLKAANAVIRSQRVWEPDLTDRELQFGTSTRMIPGRAFSAGAQNVSAPVAKSYESVGTRRLLVESCDYEDVAPWLEKLPKSKKNVHYEGVRLDPDTLVPGNLPEREAPRPRWASLPFKNRLNEQAWASVPPDPLKTMDTGSYLAASGPGMVLDYTISGSLPDYTFKGDTTYEVTGSVSLTGTATLEGGAVIKFPPASSAARLQFRCRVICATTRYRPAVFTAKDDDSVGETISGSSGRPSGYYASPALEIWTSGTELHDLRINHAQTGISFYDYSAGSNGNTVRDCQLASCEKAIRANGYGTYFQNLAVRNVLIYNASRAFYGYNFNAQIEHLTVNGCAQLAEDYNGNQFGATSLSLRNSLLVAVSADGNASVNRNLPYTQDVGSSAGVFQEVGRGIHYLAAGSPYRDAGTDQINPDLLADLQTLTTHPPVVQDDVTLSIPTQWSAQVDRDLGPPDLGYHYPALDYAVDDLTVVQGGSLSVAPGIVIGAFGDHGIVAEDYGRVTLRGTAGDRIKVVHFTTVQEQSGAWDGNPSSPSLISGPLHAVIGGHDSPDVELRFVDTSVLGGRGSAVLFQNNWAAARTLVARDCRFFGGSTCFASHYSQLAVFDVSNNLFRRTIDRFYGWMSLTAHNNLFWGGVSHIGSYVTQGGAWELKDNAFHDTSITGSSSYITRGNNAYLGTVSTTPLGWITASDISLSRFDYATGPLGEFYHAGAGLKDRGSRTAEAAGLYHHTTQADLLKEAASQVDIGFHHVGLDLGGENRALNGTASQVTTYAAAVADRANDNNRDGVYSHGSVSHTKAASAPWWAVDLGEPGPIAGVRLWNRTDCCMTRLSDFYVFVSPEPFQYHSVSQTLNQPGLEAFYLPGAAGITQTVLTHTAGRYLRLQLTAATYLNMAEVEVMSATTDDTDGDGIPDYLEDANGNGIKDHDETDWRTSEYNPTGGLGLVIFAPVAL